MVHRRRSPSSLVIPLALSPILVADCARQPGFAFRHETRQTNIQNIRSRSSRRYLNLPGRRSKQGIVTSDNWTDDSRSSRNDPDVRRFRPPRRDHGNDGGNTFAHMYTKKTTDEFKQPWTDMDEDDDLMGDAIDASTKPNAAQLNDSPQTNAPPPWKKKLDSAPPQQNSPPPIAARPSFFPGRAEDSANSANMNSANIFRHPFQTSSTDDFKRPHGMPSGMATGPARPQMRVDDLKMPWQSTSTDEFRRSSDGPPRPPRRDAAPQQPTIHQGPDRSETAPWRNHVGNDSFESTLMPNQSQQSPLQNLASHGTVQDATIVNDQRASQMASPMKFAQLPRATPPVSEHQVQWEQSEPAYEPRRVGGGGGGGGMAIRPVRWPLVRDPPGVASEFPLLMTRILVTCFSSVATWYLHLQNGFSPVLASSAVTLLVSTCLDRRLGQAAFCGSFAGMSGGHLLPNLGSAALLGALSSGFYELLININNVCLGIGGRLGATAFLAASVLAKYRGVRFIGRKLRRGVWSSSSGVSSVAITMILFHVLGAVATIMLRESSDDSAAADPVRASSVVGVLGSLFINDPTSALALYGGSFVGMSLPSRLMYGNAPGNARQGQPQGAASLLASFAGAGAIAGLIHALTIHSGYWTGGWGGKAGLCAFAGCWVYRGMGNVSRFLKRSSHQSR